MKIIKKVNKPLLVNDYIIQNGLWILYLIFLQFVQIKNCSSFML